MQYTESTYFMGQISSSYSETVQKNIHTTTPIGDQLKNAKKPANLGTITLTANKPEGIYNNLTNYQGSFNSTIKKDVGSEIAKQKKQNWSISNNNYDPENIKKYMSFGFDLDSALKIINAKEQMYPSLQTPVMTQHVEEDVVVGNPEEVVEVISENVASPTLNPVNEPTSNVEDTKGADVVEKKIKPSISNDSYKKITSATVITGRKGTVFVSGVKDKPVVTQDEKQTILSAPKIKITPENNQSIPIDGTISNEIKNIEGSISEASTAHIKNIKEEDVSGFLKETKDLVEPAPKENKGLHHKTLLKTPTIGSYRESIDNEYGVGEIGTPNQRREDSVILQQEENTTPTQGDLGKLNGDLYRIQVSERDTTITPNSPTIMNVEEKPPKNLDVMRGATENLFKVISINYGEDWRRYVCPPGTIPSDVETHDENNKVIPKGLSMEQMVSWRDSSRIKEIGHFFRDFTGKA